MNEGSGLSQLLVDQFRKKSYQCSMKKQYYSKQQFKDIKDIKLFLETKCTI